MWQSTAPMFVLNVEEKSKSTVRMVGKRISQVTIIRDRIIRRKYATYLAFKTTIILSGLAVATSLMRPKMLNY